MRRPWLAGTLLMLGLAAILLLWFNFGADRSVPRPSGASSVLGGGTASTATPMTPASPPSGGGATTGAGAAASDPAQPVAPGPADGSTTADPASAPPAGSAHTGSDDPNAAAADRRQIGLAEAAGQAPPETTSAAAPSLANQWVDADAAGVNEGVKQQAAGVTLRPAPVVDPTQVLPANGLTNGCVAGYGRGAQCLPQTPPSHAGHVGGDMSIYWTCTEARLLLPDGIVLDTPGSDPLGLDSNADGTACGPGDR
jgi:hypothetical protein